jgi:hypothetical protein
MLSAVTAITAVRNTSLTLNAIRLAVLALVEALRNSTAFEGHCDKGEVARRCAQLTAMRDNARL